MCVFARKTCDVDDVAASSLHQGKRCVAAMKNTCKVSLNRRIPLFDCRLLDITTRADPCVVHQDIKSAEDIVGAAEEIAYTVVASHIASRTMDFSARLVL